MNPWHTWIVASWPALCAGHYLVVPPGMPSPSTGGFAYTIWASHVGQAENWVVSCSDGSRVHLWRFADGRLVAHRDRYDPKKGIVATVAHLATETTGGQLVSAGTTAYGLARMIGWL